MNLVAATADRMDHHPEWSSVHCKVETVLTTHDAGSPGDVDTALACAIDQIACGDFGPRGWGSPRDLFRCPVRKG